MYSQSSYKQTEIGRIPKDWEVSKVEKVFSVVTGTTPSTRENKYWVGTINWITPSDLSKLNGKTKIKDSERKITHEALRETNLSLLPKDSIILSTRAPVGYVAMLEESATFNQGCKGLIPKKSNEIAAPFFCYYLLNQKKILQNLSSGSTFKELSKERLQTFTIPVPPLSEQKKIAEILSTVDWAIEKVGEAIEKTQRLKKGLMQELLTKGIGHKEFKETEIRRIPKDWNVVRISDIADVKGGKRLPKGQKLINSKTPYPYIRVLDFKNMGVDVSNVQFLLPETHKSIKQYIISSNDVYISIAGTVGIVGLIPPELDNANLTENAAKLCNLRNITKEFLAYFLNSNIGQNQISVYLGKAQQPKLALFRIEKIKVSLPPIPEQQKIADILGTVDERLELLRKRKERLERTKKGLMNDLLTGKVRVTKLIVKEA